MDMGQRVPFSVTISGKDARGLLAKIGDILEEQGCVLEDTRISRLVGLATGILIADAPPETTLDTLTKAFDAVRALDVRVEVREAPDDGWPSRGTPFSTPYLVSYEGADKPEMLVTLARKLAAAGCTFADVSIDSTVGNNVGAYVLVCEIDAPMSLAEVQEVCQVVGREHGIELSVIPANMDDLVCGAAQDNVQG